MEEEMKNIKKGDFSREGKLNKGSQWSFNGRSNCFQRENVPWSL